MPKGNPDGYKNKAKRVVKDLTKKMGTFGQPRTKKQAKTQNALKKSIKGAAIKAKKQDKRKK